MVRRQGIGRLRFRPADAGQDTADALPQAVAADLQAKFGHFGDLLDIFVENTGAGVHKWHHYLPIYERYFAPFRNRPLRFLEIGVSKGGSLQMWRKYFGPGAVIFGVDIDPACARFDGQAGQVRIGSQADTDFLDAVVAEMGGVDIVLDDGSHRMDHVAASLRTLFPHLSSGGVYMIEDLHTAYWENFGGGLDAPANFFNVVRGIVDDMHHWYHGGKVTWPVTAGGVTGIHIHDSIVVLDKETVHAPVHSLIGEPPSSLVEPETGTAQGGQV
jgi:SAM-dependent methyltransferase